MIMKTKYNILLAEDDEQLGELMKEALEEEGYQVSLFGDGQLAIDNFDKQKFDFCLLDVNMPGKDGFTVAKKIRQQSDIIPIIFISTRAQMEDKIEGYAKGADDYVVKPFAMKELLMKLQVFRRRSKKMFSDSKKVFMLGQLTFSYTDLRLSGPEIDLKLKQREADLLLFLSEHSNRILKREEILTSVWGKDDYFLGRSMDVFMSKLRKYLRSEPAVVLETIHGVGYRFSLPA